MQVNIALLTVTDTRTIETDKSGAILVKKIGEQNHKLIDRKLVRDEAKQYQDLENLMKIRHAEVFFTSNTSEILRQGTPTGTTYIQQMGESMQQYIKTHDTDVE